MATEPIEFAPLMGPVAARLLGESNRKLSKGNRLRFGSHGSMEVDIGAGWFDDHEVGRRGGVLDLIQHKLGGSKGDALRWLETEGLKDVAPKPSARQPDRSRPTAPTFYDYADEAGAIAYRIERRGKGSVPPFLQHGPDGKGGFHSVPGCMQNVPRLPYRLPDLLAADPSEIVFVCEGEKDVDRLRSSGIVATTNPGGAGKFTADLAPHFAGRRVIALQDNDEPGANHAASVCALLEGIAAAVAPLLLPNLPPKGDVSDWLDSGGDAAQLRQIAENALPQTAAADTFELADLQAWARTQPTPKAFFMAPFIPRDDVVIVTGDGGTNKSTLALQISACAAAGQKMLGMEVMHAPALYITAEDDNRENHWRLAKIAQAIGTSIAALAGRLHVVSLRGRLNNELAIFDSDGRLRAAPAYALLRSTIEKTGAKIVTLDNVAHLFAGNENDRGQVTAFINLLYQICGDLGVTILLIAHRNKSGDSYSGSTAWLNAVRSQILLERGDGDPDLRRLTLGKANYARQGEELTFRWYDFALVRDRDLPADRVEELTLNAAAAADNAAFLACLRERTAQGEGRQVGSKPGPNYAPAQFQGMAQAKGLSKDRLALAMERLFHIRAIATYEHRNTAKGRTVTLIREVSSIPRTPTPNPSRTDPDPIPEPLPNAPRTPPHTLSISKDIPGGAPSGSPPPVEEKHVRTASGLLLAPGESEDDPVPGWGD